MLKKNISILLLFCWCSIFSIQGREATKRIQWRIHERFSDTLCVVSPGFEGALYNEYGLPLSVHTYHDKENCHFQIHAAESELVPDDVLQRIDTYHLTEEPQIQVTSNQGVTTVSVLPFFKDGDVIKRLTHYQLTSEQKDTPLLNSTPRHHYCERSILASGSFIKIRVGQSGIYKITYEELTSWGLQPSNVRIFGYGGAMISPNFNGYRIDDVPEVPIYIHKGDDNIFGKGDYILFHAQGPVSWEYSPTKKLFLHTMNTYSTHGYYFLTSDLGEATTLNEVKTTALNGEMAQVVRNYDDYLLHEQELINILDPTGANGGGQEFFGEQFNTGNTTFKKSFHFPNIVEGSLGKIKTQLVAASTIGTTTFRLTIDNQEEKKFMISAMQPSIYVKGILGTNTQNFTATKDNVDIELTADFPSDGKGYLNYIEVHVLRQLIMSGDIMYFRSKSNLASGKHNQYIIEKATPDLQVWNITHLDSIYRMPAVYSNNELRLIGSTDELQQYVALRTSGNSFGKVEYVERVAPQNLHSLKDVEYVIIAPEAFRSEAERLAMAHEEKDGFSWIVVSDQEIYNEFSSGTPDASAYRWFMKMLYDRHLSGMSSKAPRYLLLMGDGTFDNRKLLHNSGTNTLLTYQSNLKVTDETFAYPTDDYFGFLDDTDDTEFKETSMYVRVGIGRFPVTTKEQAKQVVDKTIAYMQDNQQGNWHSQLCFMADDGDRAEHMKGANKIADTIHYIQPDYQVSKILLDSYFQEVTAAGESYPMAKNKLDNQLNDGVLYLCYLGHGSPTAITNENMLTFEEITKMSNHHHGIWGFGTCSFSHWDAQSISAGEAAVLNPNGGAIGVFSAARTVYADANERLLMEFSKNLFPQEEGKYVYIGDAVRLAKNAPNREANRMAFLYLGDPALRIAHPMPYKVRTDSINHHSAHESDTLRALSINKLIGSVIDKNNEVATNFNGTIFVTLFDKEQLITTLNNHNEESHAYPFSFKDRISVLFKGNVEVHKGKFELNFMLPKDIQYNYGPGRICYYAQDSLLHHEAIGSYNNFLIGGSDTTALFEEDGPNMDIYLNSLYFVSGGKVDDKPLFIAYLNDSNGINTSGSGVGHDLQLTIDNDPEQTWNLNDAFVADNGNFRSGSIHYRMSSLEEGQHNLKFRAWDLLNNSTTRTLDFEVVKGLAPEVYQLITYPNPAKSNEPIHFILEHDRPELILETTIHIFDVSGRKIYSLTQKGSGTVTFTPQKASIGSGIYLYQFHIKTADSEITTEKCKIIILGQ